MWRVEEATNWENEMSNRSLSRYFAAMNDPKVRQAWIGALRPKAVDNDMQNLLLTAQQAADFLARLAVHLEESGFSGQAGNCMIHVHKLRAALDKVDPPSQSAKACDAK